MTRMVATSILGAALLLPGTAALADDEESTPRLEIGGDIEIQNDGTFSSDDPDAEINDLYATVEPELGFYILPGLSIQTGLVMEPVIDGEPGEDRTFDNEGLYAEQLFLQYEGDSVAVYGGKFNLPFGIAQDEAPGLYGTDIAEDFYERTERIGFGGALIFGGGGIGGSGSAGGGFGEHRLSAQTFFADTTFLSGSLGEERPRLELDDGGPSNTEDLSSFAITLNGGDFEGVPFNPGYHLGLLYEAGGEGDPEDELGLAAGLTAAIPLGEDTSLNPLVEYVHFDNADAQDQNRDIITAGLGLEHGPWNAAATYGRVWTDPNDPALDDLDVEQIQFSMGYGFDFGLAIDVGYKFVQEEDIDSHVVGVLFHYDLDFVVQ